MKTGTESMAIVGGPPAFSRQVHVGRPNIGDSDAFLQRAKEILDSRWLTNNGRHVRELEARICDWIGVEHCVLVCNATVGLSVLAHALGLQGEVIMPSLTFVATAHSLAWLGIKPVFCDVDEVTHLIDPAEVERLVTSRTTGILGVHLWGRVCDVDRLEDIAGRHGLRLAFDAAHAFGCGAGGRRVGGFGDAEVFSFHATKFFNTFEGGAITTNDDELAGRLRLMVNFGFAGFDDVVTLGTNGKMSEINAAMGLSGFDAIPDVVSANQRNHREYRTLIDGIPGCRLLGVPDGQVSNNQYVVMEYEATTGGLSRDQLIDVLWAENVVARRYFYPGCHRMEPYRTSDPSAAARLPRTESIVERLVVLPTGPSVTSRDVTTICDVISTAVTEGPELLDQMRGTA